MAKRPSKRVVEASTVILWTVGFDPGDDVPDFWAEKARTDAEHVLALIDEEAP